LARQVRDKITEFTFKYTDISYTAKNDATAVTNQGALRLSEALPNLKIVKLPATREITDEGIAAFLKNLPKLKSLEVSGASGGSGDVTGKVFDELLEHAEWAPGLKNLFVLDREQNKDFMKSMRAMSKEA
jgi:hypothetical protein